MTHKKMVVMDNCTSIDLFSLYLSWGLSMKLKDRVLCIYVGSLSSCGTSFYLLLIYAIFSKGCFSFMFIPFYWLLPSTLVYLYFNEECSMYTRIYSFYFANHHRLKLGSQSFRKITSIFVDYL